MAAPIVVLSTCDSEAEARRLSRTLVDEGLAACINVVPGVTSVYEWQGEVQEAAEWLLVIKSTDEAYPRLEVRVRELHTYDLPELIVLPTAGGAGGYLAWLRGQLRS